MVNKETFCHLDFLQDKKHDCLAKIAQIYSSLLLTGGNHMDESFMLSHLYWKMEICLLLFLFCFLLQHSKRGSLLTAVFLKYPLRVCF